MIIFRFAATKYWFLGVIQRQSIKYTAINFIGTFLGFLSVIFIYTLDHPLYGYFQTVYGYAVLLVPFLSFGIQSAIVKFYPEFVQQNKASRFLVYTLILTTISVLSSSVILLCLYFLLRSWFAQLFPNFSEIDENLLYIFLLSYIITYISIFHYHAVAKLRIVIPDILVTLGLKLFLPFLILMVYLGYWPRSWFMGSVLVYFCFVCIALFYYLNTLGHNIWKPDMALLDKGQFKEFRSFMGFAMLNGLGATLALRLDIAMIAAMISLEAVGIYGIIMTISNVMEIPAKALNQISGPVISTSWANENHENIQDVYQKSSVYGLIGGLFLFLLLYFIWPDIIQLMSGKNKFDLHTVLMVFSFLSIARIIDLVTGVNSIIISYSKDYKFHMYFLLVLGGLNFILNFLLLPKYGIIGAAIATAISYVIFNVIKYVFVQVRFGFRLHFRSHILIIASGLFCFVVLSLVNTTFHPIVNLCLKSIIIATIYGLLMYFLNPGGEIRQIVYENLNKLPFIRRIRS